MIIKCNECGQKNNIEIENVDKKNKCGKCGKSLDICSNENYEEIMESLKQKFEDTIPSGENLLSKTKIIKNNMLKVLETAYDVAQSANRAKTIDASGNKKHINNEIDKIKKELIKVSVFGQMGSGKSSFLNLLIKEDILEVGESKATTSITVIRHIDNFKRFRDGDIEIYYKDKKEVLFNIYKSLNSLDECFGYVGFSNFHSETLEKFMTQEKELLEKLENADIDELDREDRNIAITQLNFLENIINNLKSYINDLGTTKKTTNLKKGMTTSDTIALFLNKIVYYKNIEYLKNIELVDTPGLGSISQLDTIKSESYLSESDVIMVLTEGNEPIEKESESDIFHILSSLKKKTKNDNFFDKVFIVVNKIDSVEKNREEIKNLLLQNIRTLRVKINEENILYLSSKYEKEKKSNSSLETPKNVTDEDIINIEKSIFGKGVAQVTSDFIRENMERIDTIFKEINKNIDNSIKSLDKSIEDAQGRIDNFNKNKDDIGKNLKKNLQPIVIDAYRDGESFSLKIKDDELNKVKSYDYFYNKAEKGKIFAKATMDSTSGNHYAGLAKELFNKIIFQTNTRVENRINNEIFTSENKNNLAKSLELKTYSLQKEYESDYGVTLTLEDIEIDTIKMSMQENLDFGIGFFKNIFLFLNPWIWGSKEKVHKVSSEKWEEYATGTYDLNLKAEINRIHTKSQEAVFKKLDIAIANMIKDIENQLTHEREEKEKISFDKEKAKNEKELIKEYFTQLHTKYIGKAQEQNKNLFK